MLSKNEIINLLNNKDYLEGWYQELQSKDYIRTQFYNQFICDEKTEEEKTKVEKDINDINKTLNENIIDVLLYLNNKK